MFGRGVNTEDNFGKTPFHLACIFYPAGLTNDKIQGHLKIVKMLIQKSVELHINTRKYPLRGYILGVLTHTTALDRLWGGDETLTMWF